MSEPNATRLGMIQAIIERLANNSAALKRFSVTLVAALVAGSETFDTRDFYWIGIAVTLVFCAMDSYYLSLERSYRALYDRAIGESETVWSLDAGELRFPMIKAAARSFSIWPLYGLLLGTTSVALAISLLG